MTNSFRFNCTEGVPVTTRGAGTGNYGQAMPLAGGIVLHTRHLNAVVAVHPGSEDAEPAMAQSTGGPIAKPVLARSSAPSSGQMRTNRDEAPARQVGTRVATAQQDNLLHGSKVSPAM